MAASRRHRQQALALLACACLLAGAASGGRVDVEDMVMMDRFRAWQAAYNRSYVTAAERLRRFEVYRQNMELIEATNRLGLSYTLGETPFTDLTSEEFLAMYTMPPGALERESVSLRVRQLITTRAGPVSESRGGGGGYWNYTGVDVVPQSVDWRTKGAVTPVKDQQSCGSCWAFATVATIESLHKIKTGQLVSLSEQELLDCVYPGAKGCDGGNPVKAMEWVINNGGLTTEADYPYENKAGQCKVDKTRNRVVKISDRDCVKAYNEAAMEAAVARQPIAVVVHADPIQQHYKGGVYRGPCDPAKVDHAVTVVGYGAEPGGLKYWIVKNSWGGGWGENGYFRIERRAKDKRGACGIATLPCYPLM
ncbi:hypothetical protein BS78_02G337700 [Paspalum vaginatum]|nr:hypothetical protein BS78_02G337700 [Paspalum vaginatum]